MPPFRRHGPLFLSQESEADMEMASALVARFEPYAEGDEDGAPWWFGWAIHRAFLIGLRLGRTRAALPPAEVAEPDEPEEAKAPPRVWQDWSEEDEDWLTRNWMGCSDEDLAEALGRTKDAVAAKRQNRGLLRGVCNH